jgi:2-oxoisovalerate dehydrogenase E1 component beta subunit
VIFFEPKLYYRSLSDEIPEEDYMVPLGKAAIIQEGKDISIVGWGAQIQVLKRAVKSAEEKGISCELIDLRTLLPWDKETVVKSVKKTGRLLVSHEVLH